MISFRFDNTRYSRAPELTELSLFHCQYYHTTLPWEGRSLFSPHTLLFYVSDGGMRVSCENAEYVIEAGRFFLLVANRSYRIVCDRQLSMYQITFSCTSSSFLEALPSPAVFSCPATLTHRVIHLHHDFQSNRSVELCELRLLEILMELAQPTSAARDSGRLFHSFCRYCNAHLNEALDAETVSAALGCHKDHLNRLVKRFCGKTFRDYVATVKLEAAQTLLGGTDLTVEQIAHNLGFATPELFVKFFRYHTGTTPRRYRR